MFVADFDFLVQLFLRAEISVNTFFNKNWLERCKTEYYTTGEPAGENDSKDLRCIYLSKGVM